MWLGEHMVFTSSSSRHKAAAAEYKTCMFVHMDYFGVNNQKRQTVWN